MIELVSGKPQSIRPLAFMRGELLYTEEASSERTVNLPSTFGGSPRVVQMAGSAVSIFKIDSVVFEPHQDVLFQDNLPYLQVLNQNPGRLPVEGLALGARLLLWNSRRFGVVARHQFETHPVVRVGIPLFGKFSGNWYHWMVNILPRAYLAEKSGCIPPEVPWLVSEDLRGTNFEQALEVINQGRRRIVFLPNEPHGIEEAYIVESPVRELAHAKSRRPFSWARLGDFHFEVMESYRDCFIQHAAKFAKEADRPAIDKIFLHRSGQSRPLNLSKFEEVLARHGFKIVEVEKLAFVDQIRLFSQAQFIVGSTGAQWTGLLFARNARALFLVPPFLSGNSLFAKLTMSGESALFDMIIKTAATSWSSYFATNQVTAVVAEELDKALRHLCGSDGAG
jgi:capsular polysaccharide biosynthesis protein